MKQRVLIGIAFALSGDVFAIGDTAFKPVIEIRPDAPLVDEVVAVRLAGLPPGAKVTLRAEQVDGRQRSWVSHGVFLVQPDGSVDVGRQAPEEGSYSGIDPMGLIWSATLSPATPDGDKEPGSFVAAGSKPLSIKLILEMDGKSVAEREFERRMVAADVTSHEIKEDGLVGVLHVPPGSGPHPAILVLSGSEGGIARRDAALLASHGYVAFAAAYFRADGLPDALIRIPIETPEKALQWLGKRPEVDPRRIGVLGGSKGGELALLLGSMFPSIRAVVAYVPSHVVWQGIANNGPPPNESSWTYKGEPLPFIATKGSMAFGMKWMSGQDVKLLDIYAPGLHDSEAVEKSLISVEKINGPIMLISGGDDALWPSSLMAEKVVERLKKNNFPHRFEHLSYPQAGHGIRKAFLPSAGTIQIGCMLLGGTEEANAKAQGDSWPKVLKFLESAMK